MTDRQPAGDLPITFDMENFATKNIKLVDFFAGMALCGLVHREPGWDNDSLAEMAYELADAMLEARGDGYE